MMLVFNKSIIDEPLISRFLDKIHFDPDTDCWIWSAAKTLDGYGHFGLKNNRNCRAHRFMYWLNHGEMPKHMEISHSCDTRECVNPSHLKLATHYDNIQECKARGRVYDKSGSNNPKAKLDERHVEAIRLLYHTNNYSYDDLALIFKVGKSTITNIIIGNTWR